MTATYVGAPGFVLYRGKVLFQRCAAEDCRARPRWLVGEPSTQGAEDTRRILCWHHAEQASGQSLGRGRYSVKAS